MTPQQLKNSILQYAIQGKLVEQRAEEGTAEELYAKIQEEKQKLIKEGKLKKEKPLAPIEEDEIPFDIPKTWKWCKLGDISTYSQTKKKVNGNYLPDDIWSLDLEDIEKETGRVLRIIRSKDRKNSGDKTIFYKGNILYTKLRPYLKKILIAEEKGACSSEIVPFSSFANVDHYYLLYVLKSQYVDSLVNSSTFGVKMPRVSPETMTNIVLPLPPLGEQKRIVAKIEELMALADKYADSYLQLEALNKKFPADIQKSILQYAIQGKLVEQRAEEGTAEELYAKIQEEKQKLIKEGKLKKEKPLAPISDKEIPFAIPKSWKWVRLKDICKDFLVPQRDKPKIFSGNIPWCRIEDIDGMFLSQTHSNKYVSEETVKAMNLKVYPIGTVVTANSASIGKTAIATVECCTNQTFIGIVCNEISLFNYYLLYFLQSQLGNLKKIGKGTTISYISRENYENYLFPLPPLAEQKRIVAKIEELKAIVKKLE